jgi:hypothetical protein
LTGGGRNGFSSTSDFLDFGAINSTGTCKLKQKVLAGDSIYLGYWLTMAGEKSFWYAEKI